MILAMASWLFTISKRIKDNTVQALQGELGSFSPDSRWLWIPKVVEMGNGFSVTHIVLVDLSTTPYTQHDLIPDTATDDDAEPIWSQDSKSLYVTRRAAGHSADQGLQIYRIDIATGAAQPLVPDPQSAHSNLALSPSGDQLLFQRITLGGQGARPQVWVYDFKAQAATRLITNGNLPRWLP